MNNIYIKVYIWHSFKSPFKEAARATRCVAGDRLLMMPSILSKSSNSFFVFLIVCILFALVEGKLKVEPLTPRMICMCSESH